MNYKIGYKGDDLKQYQRQLGIDDDGIFGKQTDNAVRKFQGDNNLNVDGIIGKNTIGAFSGLGQKQGINANTLGQAPDMKGMPTYEPQQRRAPDFSNLLTQAKDFYKEDEATALERQRQQGIITALQGAGGRADIRKELYQDEDLQAKKLAMQNASNRMTRLQSEEDAIFDRYKNAGEDRAGTRTTRAWQASRGREERDIAIEKRYAAADFMSRQGDYQGAKEQIDQAINDTFADRQDELTARKEQLKWLDEESVRKTGRRDKELELAFKQLEREEAKVDAEKEASKVGVDLALQAGGINEYMGGNVDDKKNVILQGIANGTIKKLDGLKQIDKLNEAYQEDVDNADASVAKATTMITAIDELFANPKALERILGYSGRWYTVYPATKAAEDNWDLITSMQTLENTKFLKGAMSDKDIELLRKASTLLSLNKTFEQNKKTLSDMKLQFKSAILKARAIKEGANKELKSIDEDLNWIQNDGGFSKDSDMNAIIQAESGGDPKALSKVDITKDGHPFSVGLTQINLTQHKVGGLNCPSAFSGKNGNATIKNPELYKKCVKAAQDPKLNLAVAKKLYNTPQGKKHWGAYTSGAYKKYLS